MSLKCYLCLQEKITKLRNEVISLGNNVSTPDTEESFNAVIGQIEVKNFAASFSKAISKNTLE